MIRMENPSFRQAQQHYDAAFHLLTVTFPSVQDPRLLLAVIHNLAKSLEAAVDALMAKEEGVLSAQFDAKLRVFRAKYVPSHFSPRHVFLMNELHNLTSLHERAPMEFMRQQSMVLCEKDYRVRTISARDARQYLDQAKLFLELAEGVLHRKD